MSEDLDQALRYEMKAAELRAIARDDDHKATRAALLQVAETYEHMAQTMKEIHASASTRGSGAI